MTLTPRQAKILQTAREHGTVRIGDLAADMDVSLETVRRDIRPLVNQGEIAKLHGAVTLASTTSEAPFERRMRDYAAEKRRIGQHVARMIKDGDSLMLDTGTTTSILARELLGKRGLTIVTNSSDVARTLATVNANKVYMAGGELHGDNGAAFGRSAIEFIANFKVQYAIISIGAVDSAMGLMDYQLAEAEFARRVLESGKRRLVLTDHTKFNRTALVRVAGFGDFDLLVTDRTPPPDVAQCLAEAGTSCEVAGESRGAAEAARP